MANRFAHPGHPQYWPQLQVLRRIWRASLLLKALHQPHFRTIGLSILQFDVLSTLANSGGLSMTELSEGVTSKPSRIAAARASLEQEGLLKTGPADDGSDDEIVELTPTGERLFEETFPGVVNHAAAIIDRALSEPEQKTLATLLDRLITSLGAPDPGNFDFQD